MIIVGRKREQEQLDKIFKSKESEFITIYGRRRIGKTYLIKSFFTTKDCVFFHATGLQGGSMQDQLNRFATSLSDTFFNKSPLGTHKNWNTLFTLLHSQVEKADKKVVIFLDELPWMATRKSKLLQEIDYFWNHYWSMRSNIILIVCGSSASWLIKKIIYNKGGLHNRTTLQIRLLPFNLTETNDYLKSRGLKLTHQHVLSLYMAMGGVPYYLKYAEPGFTAPQIIEMVFFDKNAPLKDEFNLLFNSLFDDAAAYKELIELIAQKRTGTSRAEIAKAVKLTPLGGGLSERLKELQDAGFIEDFIPWGRTRGEYYKVIDEFCLFYLRWKKLAHLKRREKDFWIQESQRPAYHAWAGYAFEAVCMKHIDSIIQALGIKSARASGSWLHKAKDKNEDGAQIDLIIDRFDDAITLCEIKYTEQPFAIDKQYAALLNRTIKTFQKTTNVHKQIFLSFVSANGLKETLYSEEMVTGVVTLDDLFKPSH